MNAASDLIPLDAISADKAPAIYGANILDRYVEAARAEVIGEVPDLTTRKGRERIASLAAQVSRSKTAVEKPGREYLKRIKELPKAIEAELRDFVQKMHDLCDEVRQPLNDWQAAEDARIEQHQAVIDGMKERGAEAGTCDAGYLRESIAAVASVVIGEHLEEFEARAERAAAAERQRQADVLARVEAEARAREADKAHKAAILTAAKEAVMKAGITEEQAEAVISLIRKGEVPSVSITY